MTNRRNFSIVRKRSREEGDDPNPSGSCSSDAQPAQKVLAGKSSREGISSPVLVKDMRGWFLRCTDMQVVEPLQGSSSESRKKAITTKNNKVNPKFALVCSRFL